MNFEVMALIMRKAFGSPTKKQVIQMMAAHINEVSETRVWPSAAKMGLRCELHERTVRRTWGALEADGIIKAVGHKSFRGGQCTVWNVNLKAIMALPDAIPSIEKELEEEDELFVEGAGGPPDKLSDGGEGPPDTESTTPGHSVPDPRTQSPENNSTEESKEQSIPREARGSVKWTIEELWKAGPQSTRIKSSRKELATAVKAVLKKRADVTGPALVEAYARYLKRADIHRDNGKYALGVHRWVAQNRFDAFLAPGLLEAAKPGAVEVKDAARLERLDAAFWRYSRTREWHGPRDGWNLKPDMAPAGHYPPELYAKYSLKPLAAPAADQTSEEAA